MKPKKLEPLQVVMYIAIAAVLAALLYRYYDTPRHLVIGGTLMLGVLVVWTLAIKSAVKDGVTLSNFVDQPAFRWVFMPLVCLFMLMAIVLWAKKEARQAEVNTPAADVTRGW